MALTQISTGMLASGDGTVDLNIDNGTFVVDVSTSRVGIGTGSPRSILDLDGGSETQLRLQTTNSGSTTGDGLLISLDSSANAKSYIWNYENAEMIFGTNNTERMRIDASGNVGIGGTSTGYKVHVFGDESMIRMQNTGSGTNGFLDLSVNSTLATINANYSSSAIPLRFLTGAAERMRIDASGRVRIGTGTTDTGTILTVTGAATFTGQNTAHGASRLKIGQDTTAISQIRFYGADTSTAGILQFTGSSSDGTVGGERMIIDGNGNVGIGTNSPTLAGTGYRGLAINGPTGQGASVTLKNASGHVTYLYTERTGDDFLVEAVGDIVLRPAGAEKVRIDSTGPIVNDAGTVYSATAQGTGKGTIHLDPNSATNFAGNAITFGASDHGGGLAAHAGIYTRTDGSLGSEMLLSTTDSYAAGSKTGIKISNLGNVEVPRGYIAAKQPAAIARGVGGWATSYTASGWNELHSIVAFTVYANSVGSPWSNSTGRFTAPIAGYYLCTMSIYMENTSPGAHGTSYVHPQWSKNNSVSVHGVTPYQIYGHQNTTNGSYPDGVGRSDIVYCAAGDYITAQLYIYGANWRFYAGYTAISFCLLSAA